MVGLVSHWLLDEVDGIQAGDEVRAESGILINGPVWRPEEGKVGGALEFDGLDDFVDIGPVDEVEGTSLTLAFWFKADDFDIHDARFISKIQWSAGGRSFLDGQHNRRAKLTV